MGPLVNPDAGEGLVVVELLVAFDERLFVLDAIDFRDGYAEALKGAWAPGERRG